MHRYSRSSRLLYKAILLSLWWAICVYRRLHLVTNCLIRDSGLAFVDAIHIPRRPSTFHRNINSFPARGFISPGCMSHNGSLLNPDGKVRMSRIERRVIPYRTNRCLHMDRRTTTAIGLFGGIFSWFSNKLAGKWYVPPMPTGKRASSILRKHGPLQTEEETESFFETIGVRDGASLVEIGKAYENAVNTLPEDIHESLKKMFHEFLRKEFVSAFEHMESFMDRGPQAWEEYWDPTKDAFGNPVTSEFSSPEEEHKEMMERLPPQLDATKFKEYWIKNSSRFNTMLNRVDMPSRVRLTSNFTGRLVQCSSTMLPICLLGLFPQFSSLSIALQGLLASGFIFKGDHEVLLEREKNSTDPVPAAGPAPRSTPSKTLFTSLILCMHSLIGLGTCKLLSDYTSVLEYFTPQILKTACINFQFYIAALLYDTSDLTPYGHVKREEKRLSKLSETLDLIQTD